MPEVLRVGRSTRYRESLPPPVEQKCGIRVETMEEYGAFLFVWIGLPVCIHTYFAGDAETLLHDRRGVELRFTQQGECCRARKTAAGTDGDDIVLGFDDIACAGND